MDKLTPAAIAFILNSPQELLEILNTSSPKKDKSSLVSLALSGPQICVRQFSCENIPPAAIKAHLQAEAVGLFSLPLNEIELDYQVLHSTPEKVSGIFACMPGRLLKEYLAILAKSPWVPIKITAALLPVVESFCQRYDISKGRCCLLDFSFANKVNLAIFLNKQCEVLREISYDDLAEAKAEIVQAMRSASAASTVKQFDHIYCAGDLSGKKELLKQLADNLGAKMEDDISLDIKEALTLEAPVFNLSFIRPYFFSLSERKKILKVCHAAMIGSLMACVLVTILILCNQKGMEDLKSSFQPSQVDYAKKLEQQLKPLKGN